MSVFADLRRRILDFLGDRASRLLDALAARDRRRRQLRDAVNDLASALSRWPIRFGDAGARGATLSEQGEPLQGLLREVIKQANGDRDPELKKLSVELRQYVAPLAEALWRPEDAAAILQGAGRPVTQVLNDVLKRLDTLEAPVGATRATGVGRRLLIGALAVALITGAVGAGFLLARSLSPSQVDIDLLPRRSAGECTEAARRLRQLAEHLAECLDALHPGRRVR